jgi:hypothetical protein
MKSCRQMLTNDHHYTCKRLMGSLGYPSKSSMEPETMDLGYPPRGIAVKYTVNAIENRSRNVRAFCFRVCLVRGIKGSSVRFISPQICAQA